MLCSDILKFADLMARYFGHALDHNQFAQCQNLQLCCELLRGFGGVVSDHSPFTSKAPSSIPSKVILMWTRTQSSCEKSVVNALPKVVGFLRVLRFPPTGKVDWVG